MDETSVNGHALGEKHMPQAVEARLGAYVVDQAGRNSHQITEALLGATTAYAAAHWLNDGSVLLQPKKRGEALSYDVLRRRGGDDFFVGNRDFVTPEKLDATVRTALSSGKFVLVRPAYIRDEDGDPQSIGIKRGFALCVYDKAQNGHPAEQHLPEIRGPMGATVVMVAARIAAETRAEASGNNGHSVTGGATVALPIADEASGV